MPLRPHGERPAAGNPRVDEGLGGRTEAQGGKAERARRAGKRRARDIGGRGGENTARTTPSLTSWDNGVSGGMVDSQNFLGAGSWRSHSMSSHSSGRGA